MPGKDDLESQLTGLFDDLETAPEEEKPPVSLDEAVADLLRPTETEETAEPPAMETPPPIATPPEQPPEGESPPVGEQALDLEGQLEEQRAQVVKRMLFAVSAIGGATVFSLILNAIRDPHLAISYTPYFIAYVILVTLTVKRDISVEMRAFGLIGLAYLVGVIALWTEGPLSAGGLYLLGGAVLTASLVGMQAAGIAVAASTLFYTAFLLADHFGLLHPSVPYDPTVLWYVLAQSATFLLVAVGVMFPQSRLYRALFTVLREAEERHKALARSQALHERRADELSRANAMLQRRTLQLQTAAEVSGVATFSVVDADELMRQVVSLIHTRFSLHYVGLFQSLAGEEDAPVRWAELRAEAGPPGWVSRAVGYRVRVDASSAVGRCILNAKAYIAGGRRLVMVSPDDAEQTLSPPPGARSEIALPLRSRGRVLGALTLQSAQPDAFLTEDIPVLQTMADQIGVAIDNARLFAEAQARVQEMEEIQRQYGRERWAELVPARVPPLYERRREDVPPLGDEAPPEALEVIRRGEPLVRPGNGEEAALVTPISLRDEIIGALGLEDATGRRLWSEDEIALVEAVADQMALAIENARLLDETRRRAERERLTADITSLVRASTDVDSILRTAIRELGRALRASDGVIQLKVSE